MNEETTGTTTTPPEQAPMTTGTEFMYGFIVMLWVVAGAAVYVTFFSADARQQLANSQGASSEEPEGEQAEVYEEHKTIVFNSQGEVVDPEESKDLPRTLEPFSLVNQSNEKIGLEELKGKPWVGTFVFSSCPGPCSMITGRMKQLQSEMKGVDFNLVSITVDPKNDTPEKLTKYADAFTADLKNWHFLTGDMNVIYELIRSGFKMPVGEIKPGDILHTNRFVVVDSEGNYVDSFIALQDEQFHALKKRLRDLAEEPSKDANQSPAEEASPVNKSDQSSPTTEKES